MTRSAAGWCACLNAGITLRQLATHTSGLPRLAPNHQATHDEANPYARYTAALAEEGLRQASPKPGAGFGYSNFGYQLLGLALERAAGRAYQALLSERVLGPLSMTMSGVGDATRLRRPRGGTAREAASALLDSRFAAAHENLAPLSRAQLSAGELERGWRRAMAGAGEPGEMSISCLPAWRCGGPGHHRLRPAGCPARLSCSSWPGRSPVFWCCDPTRRLPGNRCGHDPPGAVHPPSDLARSSASRVRRRPPYRSLTFDEP